MKIKIKHPNWVIRLKEKRKKDLGSDYTGIGNDYSFSLVRIVTSFLTIGATLVIGWFMYDALTTTINASFNTTINTNGSYIDNVVNMTQTDSLIALQLKIIPQLFIFIFAGMALWVFWKIMRRGYHNYD